MPTQLRRLVLISLCLGGLVAANATQQPRVIYGNDDRRDYYAEPSPDYRRLADSTVALIRAANLQTSGPSTRLITDPYGPKLGLCQSEPFYDQHTAAFCSGFLLTPDTVVTAGHCVTNAVGCQDTRIVFDFKMLSSSQFPQTVPSSRVFMCKSVVYSVARSSGVDFAVLKLDRPVSHVEPLKSRTSGSVHVGEGLVVIGHPSGLPVKVSAGANVRDVNSEYLIANLDTYGGNSGSAVFNISTGLIEGILVRGESDFVYENGCRKSNVCQNTGCRGEDVTLIEHALPYVH